MLVTAEVSNLERSREVRPLQPENIEFIVVTAEVSNLERSREVRPLQPENISAILVTAEVSKPVTSREVRPEQPENIYAIVVTSEVSVAESPIKEILFDEPRLPKLNAVTNVITLLEFIGIFC